MFGTLSSGCARARRISSALIRSPRRATSDNRLLSASWHSLCPPTTLLLGATIAPLPIERSYQQILYLGDVVLKGSLACPQLCLTILELG